MTVRELDSMQELSRCEEIQRLVWRLSETEIVSLSQLRAAQHAGGLMAGAWRDGEMVGFSCSFPAYHPWEREPHGLHSHMTAVLPGSRNRGLGQALKWFQRDWCLERGLSWVEWTFDPLRGRNARLNLEHLGATVGEYLVNVYGEMNDALNSGLPSDRLVARWRLSWDRVAALQASGPALPPATTALAVLAAENEDGEPGEPLLGARAPLLSVGVPGNLEELMNSRPEAALRWRMAVRAVLCHYLQAGYLVTRFVDGCYLLEQRGEPLEM